ncbi:acetyltransferase [Sphingobium indicum IP26]|uniref:Acetyltransferase n=1 Tax=Sphingobium indicum F2 TaxID=1450518 RepID=A0A8E0WT00_9SPHN|nr:MULTISPECIES: acyltransferase [Sphingobium]EPR18931.1 acetyltransferase [Sphingobium indicum IP26]EQB00176.1 acetyltransferase [Sphingobium sp. HDIP04]KER36373.1 acetyltransferase [Sphingobium indicum F2]
MSKNPSIDLLKGVLMLLVMAGHVMEITGGHDLALWVGSGFRMPLMIGISGYLLNVTRTRSDSIQRLVSRYGRRMLLPWLFAGMAYMIASGAALRWTLPFDLLFRPPFHLWYVPTLFFLIMLTRLMPFSPLVLLAAGTPVSLSIMYGFGLDHGPLGDGLLSPDSRFLRYTVYFFFGMLMAERRVSRRYLPIAGAVALLGLLWWSGLYHGHDPLAFVPARLLMCLGLIALLPTLSALRLHFAPVNAIGRDSLFFYLWHPLVMGVIVMTGAGAAATLALSILLLAAACRLTARGALFPLLFGSAPQGGRVAPTPATAPLPA